MFMSCMFLTHFSNISVMDLVPFLWTSLIIEILEIIFLWLPLFYIIFFRIFFNTMETYFTKHQFLSNMEKNCEKMSKDEFEFLLRLWIENEKCSHSDYNKHIGKLTHISMSFSSNIYTIDSTRCSLLLLPFPTCIG